MFEDLAEDFKDDIENIKGLGSVDILAYPKQEIRVALDYERMAAQNIKFL